MTALRVTFAALVACASLTASAWWETQVVTNFVAHTAIIQYPAGMVACYDGIESGGYDKSAVGETNWVDCISGLVNYHNATMVANGMKLQATTAMMNINKGAVYTLLSTFNPFTIQLFVSGSSATFMDSAADSPWWSMSAAFKNPWCSSRPNPTKSNNTTITFGSDGTYFYAYGNGITSMTTNTLNKGTVTGTLVLGGLGGDNPTVGTTYHACRVYDRWLTNEEIAQASDLDVRRFVNGEDLRIDYNIVSTNRVYHANPPASAYDALSPWNAPARTRIGGDDRTLRPSAQIKEN